MRARLGLIVIVALPGACGPPSVEDGPDAGAPPAAPPPSICSEAGHLEELIACPPGELPAEREPARRDDDWDADGTVDSWSENRYEEAPPRLVTTTWTGATTTSTAYFGPGGAQVGWETVGGDGALQYLSYRACGATVTVQVSVACSAGTVASWSRSLEDRDGNWLGGVYDGDGDGVIDQRWVEVWQGGLLRASQYDDGDDGDWDVRWWFRYDAAGQVDRVTGDTDGDSVVDSIRWDEWDDAGRHTSQAFDTGADGTIDSRWTWIWDGDVTREEGYRAAGDGYWWTYHRDADGRLVSTDHDELADGTLDGREAYEYDAQGRLVRWTWDDGPDGTVDAITRFTP